jgi:molybdopterin-containing oxidoreductase family iron-sulfur binding subunit
METNRRSFLKLSGICALGLGALPVVDAFAKDDMPKATTYPKALVGKKWGMVIDMKKCWEKGKEGCQDCVLACHKTHNVPDIGTIKEEIKWIWKEQYLNVFPGQENEFNAERIAGKPFIVLCNHCTDPPCVRVCPTQATFKRPDGVVMMDMHRCIGCRFCMAGCPFGARSFNFREPLPYLKQENPEYPRRERGVVEKCTFCDERLAIGKLPACVEACKCGALTFGDLEDHNSAVRKLLASQFTIRRKPELGTGPNVYYIV